jgi:cell division protein FtsW
MKKRGYSLDYLLLFAALALSAIGLIMVFSASPTMALKLGDSYYFLKRHILYLLLGFSALYLGTRLDLALLRQRANVIFAVSFILLILVYIPGVGQEISGASRWIDLGLISFQPSELMKLAVVLLLADLLTKTGDKLKTIAGLLPPLLITGLIAGLIIAQPDMGTAITIAGTAFIMLFVAGAQLAHLGVLCALGAGGILMLSLVSPYRLRRLMAFLDPWQDPQGIGFQVIQSLLAVGSGGLFGLGLGASRQKFFYLPQQFTDFIFAILCEELGFIGAATVVFLFALLLAGGIRVAYRAADQFHSLLAIGLTAWLTIQATINIMVVLSLLPTTGIPLPFISYGGTATIINLFAVGIILNVSLKGKKGEAK